MVIPPRPAEPPSIGQGAILFVRFVLRIRRDGHDYDKTPIVEVQLPVVELAALARMVRNATDYIQGGKFDPDEFERAVMQSVQLDVFRTEEAKSRLNYIHDLLLEIASRQIGVGSFAENVENLFSKANNRQANVDDSYSKRYDVAMDNTAAIDFSKAKREVAPVNVSGWPTEKYNNSTERKFNRRLAIVRFLVRVWKPVLEENGRIITIAALKKIDENAARSLYAHVKRAGMPTALKGLILTDSELKQDLLEQPNNPAAAQRVRSIAALG